MNDPEIRRALHTKFLRKFHEEPDTLVIDELGLEHGKCRADIAVINGHLDGFEVKSNADTLQRLSHQILSYNAIFDHSSIVVEDRYLDDVIRIVPNSWGIIQVIGSYVEELQFKIVRPSIQNANIDNYAVAQLLWRNEAQEILFNLGVTGSQLRQKRSILYRAIIGMMDAGELRKVVRQYLKKRQNWRPLSQLPLGGD
jgi:hypothetical protein